MEDKANRNILKQISPSKYSYLKQCRLRFFIDSDEKSSYGYTYNPNSFLGIVIHGVIESFFLENWNLLHFEKKWEDVFIDLIQNYKISNDPISLVKYQAPFYITKKKKVEKLLKEYKVLVDSKKVIPEYRIKTRNIKGSIDLFEMNSEKIRVTDFKTGPIYDFEDFKIKRVKKEYLNQLKTYGLAIIQSYSINPSNVELSLVGLNDDEKVSFKFSQFEYEQHDLAITETIDSINNVSNINVLASPNQDTCKYCEYSSTCSVLHKKLQSSLDTWATMAYINDINVEFDPTFTSCLK